MTDLYDPLAAFPRLLGPTLPGTPLPEPAPGDATRTLVGSPARTALDRLRDGGLAGNPVLGPARTGRATPLECLHELRRRLPEEAVFGFHTAALLLGFGAARSTRLHVTVPVGCPVPRIRGVSAHQHTVPVRDVRDVYGLRCAPPVRCAVDLARTLCRADALPVLDAALRTGGCDDDALRAELHRHDRLRGVRQARDLVTLADGRATRRQETHLRLVVHDGYLPVPVPGLLVHGSRVALGYSHAMVGVEYRTPRGDTADHDRLAALGWTMCSFSDDDLYRRTRSVAPTIAAALASRVTPRRTVERQTRYSRRSVTSARGAQPW